MILTTETAMTGTRTAHTAALRGEGWVVSWLPGRTLDSGDAIHALLIAEAAAAGIKPGHRLWLDVVEWANYLHLTGPDALALASTPAAGNGRAVAHPDPLDPAVGIHVIGDADPADLRGELVSIAADYIPQLGHDATGTDWASGEILPNVAQAGAVFADYLLRLDRQLSGGER
jgi:hypothetical protein